jgi:iron(III) transport system ATP-binding protein
VTHDPEEAFATADTVAVMHEGWIAQRADLQTLYWTPASLAVARLTGPTVELAAEVRGDVADCVLGCIAVVRSGAANQDRIVLVRPEQIVEADDGEGIGAEVLSSTFRGDHVEARVCIGCSPLTIRLARSPKTGEHIHLRAMGVGIAF